MNNKNNKGLIILVIIVVFVIGGLCIFILFDKVLPDNNNNLNQKQIDEIGNRINNQSP